jgi:hypothetical protein
MPKPISPREPWDLRVARWRAAGKTPNVIARNAYSVIHQYGMTEDELRLTLPERHALRIWADECDSRRKARIANSASRADARSAQPPPKPRRSLGRAGLSPSRVREMLGCTRSELDRWASDWRLPPDGEKFYANISPRRWGRAWLAESIEAAKDSVGEWRKQDAVRRINRKRGLRKV